MVRILRSSAYAILTPREKHLSELFPYSRDASTRFPALTLRMQCVRRTLHIYNGTRLTANSLKTFVRASHGAMALFEDPKITTDVCRGDAYGLPESFPQKTARGRVISELRSLCIAMGTSFARLSSQIDSSGPLRAIADRPGRRNSIVCIVFSGPAFCMKRRSDYLINFMASSPIMAPPRGRGARVTVRLSVGCLNGTPANRNGQLCSAECLCSRGHKSDGRK